MKKTTVITFLLSLAGLCIGVAKDEISKKKDDGKLQEMVSKEVEKQLSEKEEHK